jgi:hypothetical protein
LSKAGSEGEGRIGNAAPPNHESADGFIEASSKSVGSFHRGSGSLSATTEQKHGMIADSSNFQCALGDEVSSEFIGSHGDVLEGSC